MQYIVSEALMLAICVQFCSCLWIVCSNVSEALMLAIDLCVWFWFSMSPLPRLHHHDIKIIVELLRCAKTKLFCHILTVVLSHFNSCFVTFQHRQKKEGKSHHLVLALALTLTLTVTPHPDHSATRHCWRLQCTVLSLMHQHYQTYCNEQYVYDVERYVYDIERYVYVKNNSTIIIMSWWCNWGNGDMENHLLF